VQFISTNAEPENANKYHAWYNVRNKTAKIVEENVTPERRVEAWVLGVFLSDLSTEEQSIEHEIRHGLYHIHHGGYNITIRDRCINEAFARSTFGGTLYSDIRLGLTLAGYSEERANQINTYYRFFRYAQASGKDEIELLKQLRDFSIKYSEIYDPTLGETTKRKAATTEREFTSQTLGYLGIETEEDLQAHEGNLKEFYEQQNENFDNWRLGIWKLMYKHVIKNNPEFERYWTQTVDDKKHTLIAGATSAKRLSPTVELFTDILKNSHR